MELGETGTAEIGDVVYWDQVRRITSVAAPEIDGKGTSAGAGHKPSAVSWIRTRSSR